MALEAIVARKRVDVAARREAAPTDTFADGLAPSDRSLFDALKRSHTGFILECKKASPSKGVIRPRFDVREIARAYAPFADAVSVLTDEPYFQGSLAYLEQVRSEVPCPVLCKDFVVEPYQIYEARHHGADAVLLMCSVLDQASLVRCLAVCRELDMDALVEVHDAAELERALDTDARIIGINNRNLQTLEVDLGTAELLCPRVPTDRICICESGIERREHVMRLRGLCDAFLIGGHLMAASDLPRAIREIVFGRVKVCGLTHVDDARAALDAGAVFGGLVLWPPSRRAISVDDATWVRDVALDWVGVFVNEDVDTVARAARDLALRAVQLHGDEDKAYVEQLRAALPAGCAVWKAQRVDRERTIGSAAAFGADRLLIDRYVAGTPGGTGKTFDWDAFRAHPEHSQMLLSGGINPENAAEASEQGGYAIDVSSGLERAPGKKDHDLISDLFAAMRGRGRLR